MNEKTQNMNPKRAIPHKPQYDAFDCSFMLDNQF